MQPDDKICLCFHVTKRKIVNFIRLEKPRRASQLSECFGAGTGCGWCRPFLERLLDAEQGKPSGETAASSLDLGDGGDYQEQRANYIRNGGGTPPPGASPIE